MFRTESQWNELANEGKCQLTQTSLITRILRVGKVKRSALLVIEAVKHSNLKPRPCLFEIFTTVSCHNAPITTT